MFPSVPFLITDSGLSFNLNWNYDGSSCYQAEGDDSEIIFITVLLQQSLGFKKPLPIVCDTYRPTEHQLKATPDIQAYELFRRHTPLNLSIWN